MKSIPIEVTITYKYHDVLHLMPEHDDEDVDSPTVQEKEIKKVKRNIEHSTAFYLKGLTPEVTVTKK